MKNLKKIALFSSLLLLSTSNTFASEQPLIVGAVSHMTRLDTQEIEIRLQAAKSAGLTAVRWNASWNVVENTDGVLSIPSSWDYIVDRANELGITPLIVLGYGNKRYDNGDKPRSVEARKAFAIYAAFVAEHFENRVRYFEMWNEWDIKIGNTSRGNLEDYVALLKVAYPSIKKAAPETTILTGSFADGAYSKTLNLGFGDMFERYLKTDAYLYSDAIAVHPYIRRKLPSEFASTIRGNLYVLSRLIRSQSNWDLNEMWVSELGWTTATEEKLGVSEKQQANIAKSALDAAQKSGYSGIIFYELTDDASHKDSYEANFGLYHSDWVPKPIISEIQSYIGAAR